MMTGAGSSLSSSKVPRRDSVGTRSCGSAPITDGLSPSSIPPSWPLHCREDRVAARRSRHCANRLKVTSVVRNAQAFLNIQKELGSFDAYIWPFVGGQPIQNNWRSLDQVPARTELSDALSKDLKRRGFTFVGSTICYALMQATGLVNDHLVGCFRYCGAG